MTIGFLKIHFARQQRGDITLVSDRYHSEIIFLNVYIFWLFTGSE